MADNNSDKNDVATKPRGASRLAILIAFIAGAFAAWIIISANVG
jgi:hypothetical protein